MSEWIRMDDGNHVIPRDQKVDLRDANGVYLDCEFSIECNRWFYRLRGKLILIAGATHWRLSDTAQAEAIYSGQPTPDAQHGADAFAYGLSALTGGKVNYYLVKVDHPQREEQPPYQAECEDIIDALAMDPNEANEFKEIWRTAAARLNNGKPGHSAIYGAEKRVHYAMRSLRKLRKS